MTFIKGRLYTVRARNFTLAVYDGQAFIGIRSKFGLRVLDAELHESAGPPHGTVYDVQDTGIDYTGAIPNVDDVGDQAAKDALRAWLDRPVITGPDFP